MWRAAGLTVPSPLPYFIGRPWKEPLVGMHLGPGVQGQTLALEVVCCPPRGSRSAISQFFSPCQTLKDLIQIPLFKLLK